MPSSSTTGSSTSASVVVCGPKPGASASRASAMIAADSTVRKTVARLSASFQISDRVASRLQCSVARIAAPLGPNGYSPAAAGGAPPWVRAGPLGGGLAFPVLSAGSIVGLLEGAELPAVVLKVSPRDATTRGMVDGGVGWAWTLGVLDVGGRALARAGEAPRAYPGDLGGGGRRGVRRGRGG